MPNTTRPPQHAGARPPKFVLRGCVWAAEHGPVSCPQAGPLGRGPVTSLGYAASTPTPAMPEGQSVRLGAAGIPAGKVRKGLPRVFMWAVWLAGALHVLAVVCLLAWVRHTPPSGAVGQKAVQMVFETHASTPANAPPVAAPAAKPAPTAEAPPMPMMPDLVPPPTVPPPVLPVPPALVPDAPSLPKLQPSKVAPPALKPHPQTPAIVQGMVHAHTLEKRPTAKQPPVVPPTPQPVGTEGPAQATQATMAPASVAHVAKGGGAMALQCTPPQTHYPPMARRLHEEGEAVVEVTLSTTGAVQAAHLIQSTGYDDLDAQALAAAQALQCAPPEGGVRVGRIPVGFHIHAAQ